jgi:predicted transcriptional regulator
MKSLQIDKWSIILLDINKNYKTIITDIYRRTNITPSHIIEVIELLIKSELVTRETVGRTTQLKTTTKGMKVCTHLIEIKKCF